MTIYYNLKSTRDINYSLINKVFYYIFILLFNNYYTSLFYKQYIYNIL